MLKSRRKSPVEEICLFLKKYRVARQIPLLDKPRSEILLLLTHYNVLQSKTLVKFLLRGKGRNITKYILIITMPEEIEGKLIGKVAHYFGHIGVAVIDLSDKLKVGETIRIVGGEIDFNQEVESMEVEHQKVNEAKKGDSVGLKIDQKVHEGYKVYKI